MKKYKKLIIAIVVLLVFTGSTARIMYVQRNKVTSFSFISHTKDAAHVKISGLISYHKKCSFSNFWGIKKYPRSNADEIQSDIMRVEAHRICYEAFGYRTAFDSYRFKHEIPSLLGSRTEQALTKRSKDEGIYYDEFVINFVSVDSLTFPGLTPKQIIQSHMRMFPSDSVVASIR